MRSTVSAAAGHRTGNEVSPSFPLPLVGAAPTPRDTRSDRHGWLLPLVAESIDATIGRKEAAARLGIHATVLSRQLTGAEGKCMNFARFGELGDAVVIEFGNRLRAHYGLDDPKERVQHAMNMITAGVAAIVAEVKR